MIDRWSYAVHYRKKFWNSVTCYGSTGGMRRIKAGSRDKEQYNSSGRTAYSGREDHKRCRRCAGG